MLNNYVCFPCQFSSKKITWLNCKYKKWHVWPACYRIAQQMTTLHRIRTFFDGFFLRQLIWKSLVHYLRFFLGFLLFHHICLYRTCNHRSFTQHIIRRIKHFYASCDTRHMCVCLYSSPSLLFFSQASLKRLILSHVTHNDAKSNWLFNQSLISQEGQWLALRLWCLNSHSFVYKCIDVSKV